MATITDISFFIANYNLTVARVREDENRVTWSSQ